MEPANPAVTMLGTTSPVTEHPGGVVVPPSPARLGAPDGRQGLPTGGSEALPRAALPGSPASVTAPYVVLAEDDVKLAGLVTRAFGHVGLATLVALTGDAALAAMRQETPVAAAVLDVMIPHPDGIEVCRQVRRDGWDGPTVLISALDSPDIRNRAQSAGADVFLAKPFQLAELLDTVVAFVTGTARSRRRSP